MGLVQILTWGSTYYLPTVLAKPIADNTGWPLTWIVGSLSLALLASGLLAPTVGRLIEARGGRDVLSVGVALCGTGLLVLAAAPLLPIYIAGWLIIGAGMSACLYDAAFSTLGRIYGESARPAISTLTLFGGLASTACWPLSVYLNAEFGWRGACAIYAGFLLLVALPALVLVLPREAGSQRTKSTGTQAQPVLRTDLVLLLAIALSVAAAISGVISIHILTLLQMRGLDVAAAVALAALIGPAQVGARALEIMLGSRYHAIWTMIAATTLVASGLALLLSGSVIALALILYGSGVGVYSIARGTLPLALFGRDGYPTVMGRLARPALITGAAAPTLGALLIEHAGLEATLLTIVALAAANTLVTLTLLSRMRA
jgi:predicted MFS family arabinose efflux permease